MVKVHVCGRCGARIREGDFNGSCPMCKRKDAGFDLIEEAGPTEDDRHYTMKYDEVLKTLEEYTEGCEPLSSEEYED